MDYYQLMCSVDETEIGYLPQIEKGSCKLSPDDPFFSANNMFYPVEFVPVTPMVFLHPQARLTDLLSSSVIGAYGILLSEGLMKLLTRFRKDGWQCFPVTLKINNEKSLIYWLPNPFEFDFKKLDFQQSSMSIIGKAGNKITDYSPKSVAELNSMIEFLKSPQKVSIDRPVFISDLDDDIIFLRYTQERPAIYISERVKDQIARENRSGISFIRLKQTAET